MSVWRMWTTCDRCGFEYKRYQMATERSNLIVCASCYDGAFDAIRHPQNYSAKPSPTEGMTNGLRQSQPR